MFLAFVYFPLADKILTYFFSMIEQYLVFASQFLVLLYIISLGSGTSNILLLFIYLAQRTAYGGTNYD